MMCATETTTLSSNTKLMMRVKLSYPDLHGNKTTTVVCYYGSRNKKRGPPGFIEAPREKKLKIDPQLSGSPEVVSYLCHPIAGHNVTVTNSKEDVEKALTAAKLRLSSASSVGKAKLNGDINSVQQFKAADEQMQHNEIVRLEAVKRKKHREEARVALENVERTVVFEDNLHILGELKKFSGYYDRSWGPLFRSPLDRLGLFLKDDSALEVDELEKREGESEEGEIV